MLPSTKTLTETADQLLYENPILIEKISNAIECGADAVPSALQEVVRFLYLAGTNDSGMLTPSHRVDLAWHEFILCTKAYCAFCKAICGRYIHHQPGGSNAENRRQYKETITQYERQFGTPDPNFWPTSGMQEKCGACETI